MTEQCPDDDGARLQFVIDLYARGVSMREIGARLDPPRSNVTVARWLTQAGIPRRTRKIGTPASERVTRECLEELYCRQGHGAQAIADHFGVTAGTVRARLRLFDLPTRPAGRPKMDGTRPPPIGQQSDGDGGQESEEHRGTER
ncbi:MAG: hypothetical protein ACQSGP_08330 [Frankia sp.]